MSKIKNISAFLFSKHFVKHFGLVLLFYVVVILSLFFYLNYSTNHGEKIFLPNFIGTNSEDAKNKIKNLGLEYQILDFVYENTKPHTAQNMPCGRFAAICGDLCFCSGLFDT